MQITHEAGRGSVCDAGEDASDLIGIVSGREQQNAEHQKSAECPVNLQFAIVQGGRELTAQAVGLMEHRKCSDHPGALIIGSKLRYDPSMAVALLREPSKSVTRDTAPAPFSFDLRAARQVGYAARGQLSLRDQGRHAHRARGGVQRHRDLTLGL